MSAFSKETQRAAARPDCFSPVNSPTNGLKAGTMLHQDKRSETSTSISTASGKTAMSESSASTKAPEGMVSRTMSFFFYFMGKEKH